VLVAVVAAVVTVVVTFAVGETSSRRGPSRRSPASEIAGERVASLRTQLAVVLPKKSCAELADVDVSVAVGAATGITATAMATAGEGYPYCRVTGVIAPQIQFELSLPTQTWRQRYLQNGCSNLCGTIAIYDLAAAGCVPLTRGDFARASTNEGHVGGGSNDGNFGTDPALRVDYAYRAHHVVAVAAKALMQVFYGQRPAYSYFDGCSEGGRNGLQEAQRYPTDFNGIVAGAPASLIEYLAGFYEAWVATAAFDGKGTQILGAQKLPVLHQAVLAACDGNDGLVDGQIDDPRGCSFDAGALLCRGPDSPNCLTAAQVSVVKKVYSGPVDERGRHLYPGGAPVGSELAWSPWLIPTIPAAPPRSTISYGIALGWLKYLGFERNPPLAFTLDQARFDRRTFKDLSKLAGLYNATDPDLSAFERVGGKLILWHGWADASIPPVGTIAYYRALQDEMGGLASVQRFARLFMFPGMQHCFGGNAPNTFDMLTPMLNWVEQGVAPSKIVATGTVNGVNRSRPVFPYPQVARYRGGGSIDDAANFVAAAPAKRFDDRFEWLGSFGTHDERP
jgi:feruloyl esterase